MYSSIEVAEKIKALAKEKNYQLKTMLDECDLSKNTLSSMLSGGSMPKSENLAKIADYLDCSVDYLLGRTDNPTLAHKKSELVELFDQLTPEDQQKLLTLFYSLKDEHTPAE